MGLHEVGAHEGFRLSREVCSCNVWMSLGLPVGRRSLNNSDSSRETPHKKQIRLD